MRARQRLWWGVVVAIAVCGRLAAAQHLDRRHLERLAQSLRQEGQAVVTLADAAAAGQARRSDFSIGWHNDYLKAQAGTFVPFVVTMTGADLRTPAVLLYMRLTPRSASGADGRRSERPARAVPPVDGGYTFEEIYPVDVSAGLDAVRFSRGFSAPPGEYDLTLVVRERESESDRGRRRMVAILRRPLSVPDYSAPELSTSTLILAERIVALATPPDPASLVERPYAIGLREVQPRLDRVFRPTDELIVVFLVYHPTLTREKLFDLEVEYHFFRQDRPAGGDDGPAPAGQVLPVARPGETYVNRTQPQRFTPQVLGPQFEPSAGQPVLAGQSVPLSEFEPGDYRLAVTVTDLVAGRTIARQVIFTVEP